MLRNPLANPQPRSELYQALVACRRGFVGVALFSGVINVLMLTGALFMMEVYDRVLPSRSVPTLVGLALIVAVLFAAQGLLEMIRGRLLSRIGAALDEKMGARVFGLIARMPLRLGPRSDAQQPLRDLDSIRSFLASSGPAALFDLPWLPLYMLVMFALHWLLGVVALIGAVALVAVTLATEQLAREPTKASHGHASRRQALAEASRRNAEVVAAMGMGGRLGAAWQGANTKYLEHQLHSSDIIGGFGALSKTLRFALQSGILALGAWLVIHGEATGGVIIGSSVLFGRALAPVDGVIANARNFASARQSWARLGQLLQAMPAAELPLPLPPPRAQLTLKNIALLAPGGQVPLVHDVSFLAKAGQAIGVIGPSGSGKSCLSRAVVGAWQPARGTVQLDGASLNQWSPEALGRHIGYLPQDVELFAGSIAENIARFEANAAPASIIAAAKSAGVHDLIVSFPEGYQTQVGEHGAALSAGQRQRIALARALYGDPFLVVLDEPNSNLDKDGEQALLEAILGVKRRGGIVIVVAHRPNVLAAVDFVLPMQQGRAMPLMPASEVQSLFRQGGAAAPAVAPGTPTRAPLAPGQATGPAGPALPKAPVAGSVLKLSSDMLPKAKPAAESPQTEPTSPELRPVKTERR